MPTFLLRRLQRFATTCTGVTLACCSLAFLASPAQAADAHADEARLVAVKKGRAAKPAAEEEAEDAEVAKPPRTRAAKAGKEAKELPEVKPEARTGTKDRRSGTDGPQREDPMDSLRERLAERLGASKANDPNVMRVTAHAPAVSPAAKAAKSSAAHGARKKPAAGAHAAADHAAHWAYEGDAGPKSWGGLKPEFTKCSTGLRQSPIDIRDGVKVQLDPVQIDYRPSSFRVIDNGHTVQVNVAAGNTIEVIGRRYELLQFHFHRPSEERINGRQFDMVAHLVHKDAEGRLAVIAVLLDRGSAHPLVQTIWNNLPLEKGEEVPAKVALDMSVLLPTDRSYFTYMGSLTTPPCSEGVLWMVMKEPVQISADQIGVFSRLYPMNARPIQSASGRLIKESN
jgi:carbonic anhydrase